MKLLIDYCNTSTSNVFTILLIGAVLFIISGALDSSQSNGFELCLSGIGRISASIFLVISLTALTFAGKNYVTQEFRAYNQACKVNAIETLGGREHLNNIGKTMKSLNSENDYDLLDMEKTTHQVNDMIIALNEEEMQLLAQGEIEY